jgi:hypothetical protein
MAIKIAEENDFNEFKFSRSWFERIKRIFKIHIENCAAAIKNAIQKKQKNLYRISPIEQKIILLKIFFNCDEYGILLRGQSISSFVIDEESSKPKKDLEKMTVLFCCSMEGEKLPCFFIGKVLYQDASRSF